MRIGTAAFTIGDAYTGVTIEAVLTGFPSTLQAYLTNQVGAGTSSANELAAGNVIAPGPAGHIGFPSGFTTVFSNLNLAPGTYYLTITSANQNGNWYDRVSPVISESPGAHHLGTYLNDTAPGPNAPALVNLTPYNAPGGFLYRVSGDLATPEPGGWVLCGLGLLAVRLTGRRRSKST